MKQTQGIYFHLVDALDLLLMAVTEKSTIGMQGQIWESSLKERILLKPIKKTTTFAKKFCIELDYVVKYVKHLNNLKVLNLQSKM